MTNRPAWFEWAANELGTREEPPNRGPAIRRYITLAHCGHEGDPWCAIFVNAALEASGLRGTRSPSSQSFRHDPHFVGLAGPTVGAIAVFYRNGHNSGLGHVGFYRGETSAHVYTLGGNENDMVQVEALPKAAASFGLVGYYWPKAVAIPEIMPVLMPSSAPPTSTKVT